MSGKYFGWISVLLGIGPANDTTVSNCSQFFSFKSVTIFLSHSNSQGTRLKTYSTATILTACACKLAETLRAKNVKLFLVSLPFSLHHSLTSTHTRVRFGVEIPLQYVPLLIL